MNKKLIIIGGWLIIFLLMAQMALGGTEVSILGNQATSVEIKQTVGRIEPFILSQINNEGPWYAYGIGVDYSVLQGRKAELDFGVVWLAETNRMNGTHWNSHFELAYDLGDQLALSLSHISHGSKFGIEKNKANRGHNWIGVVFK